MHRELATAQADAFRIDNLWPRAVKSRLNPVFRFCGRAADTLSVHVD